MNKKLYVYIGTCMAVTLLFSCFTVGAATSVSPSWSTSVTTSTRAYLSNQYTVDYEMEGDPQQPYPFGNTNIYVYTADFDILCSTNTTDAYINGMSSCLLSLGIITPTGYNLRSVNWYLDANNIPGVYSNTSTRNTVAQNNLRITSYFNNFWSSENITLNVGTVHLTIEFTATATPSNVPDPQSVITLSPVASNSTTNLSSRPDPDTQGFVAEIIEAINNSYISQDISELTDTVTSINTLLSSLKDQQSSQYLNLLIALNASNTWLQILNDVTGNIEEKLIELYSLVNSIDTSTNNIESYTLAIRSYTSTLKDLMSNFPSYSALVLQYLGKLAEMNAEQATEAAAIESEYADIKEQQDMANTVVKNVPRPSAPEINISDLTDQQTRQTFNAGLMTILSFPFIERLLIIVFTFATVGFILYGRKK